MKMRRWMTFRCRDLPGPFCSYPRRRQDRGSGHETELIQTREWTRTHHLDVLVHIFADVLDVDTDRVLLHTLVESFIGCLHLGQECLNSGNNCARGQRLISEASKRHRRSEGGWTGNVSLVPTSNLGKLGGVCGLLSLLSFSSKVSAEQ
jgi:hypothetical protein